MEFLSESRTGATIRAKVIYCQGREFLQFLVSRNPHSPPKRWYVCGKKGVNGYLVPKGCGL